MGNEHADSALGSSVNDLASFLSEQPQEDSVDENDDEIADESTADGDTDSEADSDSEEAKEEDESDDDSSEEDAEKTTTAERVIKVPERHPDGTVTEIEVTEKELIAGYERQAAFTRKTQALAERESQAVQLLASKHDEIRQQYMQQAESARAAVAQMAGLKTEAELAQLAQTDPAQWVAEVQRQKQIGAFLQGLDGQLQSERQRAIQEQQQRQQQTLKSQFEKTWQVLEQEKIDKPTLAKIYEGVNKTYGFTQEELSNVYDHRLVKLFRDATAYQQLKAQKSTVQQKVTNAPRMPAKQAPAAEVRQRKAMDSKFQSGRAKLNDLAAYLK